MVEFKDIDERSVVSICEVSPSLATGYNTTLDANFDVVSEKIWLPFQGCGTTVEH